MKHMMALLLMCFILCGCKSDTGEMEKVLIMRQELLRAESCTFDAKVTADYPDKVCTFLLRCHGDKEGNVTFTVLEPESISDISGKISESGGDLTFDDTVLAFEPLVNGTISPVIAPWLMLRSFRGGYISQCAQTEIGTRVDIDDTYADANLRFEILLDDRGYPAQAEQYYDGRRILTVSVSNFVIV